jgi:hypothetical protein
MTTGRLTLVVAERDPGVGNFIDTCGHSSGTALLRWLGAEHHPVPTLRGRPPRVADDDRRTMMTDHHPALTADELLAAARDKAGLDELRRRLVPRAVARARAQPQRAGAPVGARRWS